MSLSLEQNKRLLKELEEAFPSYDHLDEMLYGQLRLSLASITPPKAMRAMVLAVVRHFESEGMILDLVDAAANQRQNRASLQELAREIRETGAAVPDRTRVSVIYVQDTVSDAELAALEASLQGNCVTEKIALRDDTGESWRKGLARAVARAEGALILADWTAVSSQFQRLEESLRARMACLEHEFQVLVFAAGEPPALPVGAFMEQPVQRRETGTAWAATAADQLQALLFPEVSPAPIRRLERAIVAELNADRLTEVGLRAGARAGLGLTPSASVPLEAVRWQVARALLDAPFKNAIDTVERLQRSGLPIRNVNTLRWILAPNWVELDAAEMIPEIARRSHENRAFSINGGDAMTARMYVRRSCFRQHQECWKLVELSGIYGKVRAIETIAEEMAGCLLPGVGGRRDLSRLRRQLEALDREGRPVFAVFREPEQVSHELLEALHQDFPMVTFVILTGDRPLGALTGLPAVLVPELAPGAEYKALGLIDSWDPLS